MHDAAHSRFLVVEVGGTTLRAAAYAPASQALRRSRRMPSPNHLTHPGEDVAERVLTAVRALAEDVLEGQPPDVVSVAYPGPVSPEGLVLAAPTLAGPAGSDHPLRSWCESAWPQASVTVLNDVTAAGYRYVREGLRDFCIVTVGSGIGHKVFLDGRPVVGPAGRGGEIGHLRVDDSAGAPLCECGGRGHLGGLASGRGALAAVRAAAGRDRASYSASSPGRAGVSPADLDNPALVAAFRAGDRFVHEALAPAAGHLGRALAATHLLVGVETFLLVGGFALALGEPYRRMVARAAAASSWDLGQDWDAMVVLGHQDDDSGLLGAGLAAEAVQRAATAVPA